MIFSKYGFVCKGNFYEWVVQLSGDNLVELAVM